MEKRKLLFVTSELLPFNDLTEIAQKISELPNQFASNGLDVRILMPRFGTINERRHRLHEVVRLSGINVMFNDEDFALTVKVASLPSSKHRLQVYFLHNDEFFKRRNDYLDDNNEFFEDNSERMIFFNRGIMETLKKFGWAPDFIFCNGWMTSLLPMYARTLYGNDPIFSESKIFFNLFKKDFEGALEEKFLQKALLDKLIDPKKAALYAQGDFMALCKGAIAYSDNIIVGSEEVDQELIDFASEHNKSTFYLEERGENSIHLANYIKDTKPVAKGA